jgi:membrane protein DedA with SNARE-associated domain
LEELVQTFGDYITEYGVVALYLLFFLGILGMPLPEETLLVFSGFLVSTGRLSYLPTLIACYLGSISAMTVAYWIGRLLGYSFIERYGSRLGLGYKLYKRTEEWFNWIGKWILLVGYFIPGVRQFTAYFAGITKLPFPTFVLLTYGGGLVWSVLFVTLGWQLGERWEQVFAFVSRNLAVAFLVAIVAIVGLATFSQYRKKEMSKKKSLSKPKQEGSQ